MNERLYEFNFDELTVDDFGVIINSSNPELFKSFVELINRCTNINIHEMPLDEWPNILKQFHEAFGQFYGALYNPKPSPRQQTNGFEELLVEYRQLIGFGYEAGAGSLLTGNYRVTYYTVVSIKYTWPENAWYAVVRDNQTFDRSDRPIDEIMRIRNAQ